MLGSLRHPNIVWVYGMVLPGLQKEVKDKQQSVASASGVGLRRGGRLSENELVARPPALVTGGWVALRRKEARHRCTQAPIYSHPPAWTHCTG